MDEFWCDPHHKFRVRAVTGHMFPTEGLVRALLPAARRRIQPLQAAPVIMQSFIGIAGVVARWGLVPPWAKPEDARELAARFTLVDAHSVARAAATKELWHQPKPSCRCLVPATGWIGRSTADHRYAFLPDDQPVTYAAVQRSWWIKDRDASIVTFAILLMPSRGHASRSCATMPLIIPASARERWLSEDWRHAEPLLAGGPMAIDVRRVESHADDEHHPGDDGAQYDGLVA